MMDNYLMKLKVIRNYAISMKKHSKTVNVLASLDLIIATIDNFIKAINQDKKPIHEVIKKYDDIINFEKDLACKYLSSSMFKKDICNIFDDIQQIFNEITQNINTKDIGMLPILDDKEEVT